LRESVHSESRQIGIPRGTEESTERKSKHEDGRLLHPMRNASSNVSDFIGANS